MKDETGKITFDQDEQTEVNRIVEERLNRERSKYSDYEDAKGVLEELNAFGYQGSAKEVREAVKAQREAVAKQAELEELKKQSQNSGTSPEVLAEIKQARKEAKEANDKLATIEAERTALKQAETDKKTAQEVWNTQYKEFTDAYPDVDDNQLAENPKFKKFIKGKNLPLKELYEDFIDFIGETETEAIKKVTSKAARSTGSGKESSNAGGTHGLTASQIELVDQWNKENPRMKETYQSYASKLRR